LTGKIVKLAEDSKRNFMGTIKRLIGRAGEPMVRGAVRQAMKIMGHQFVMGRSIEEALKRSHDKEQRAYRHSFDMLGEAAFTKADAERYFEAYRQAIIAIGSAGPYSGLIEGPSISVKLSALHPRYEKAKQSRVLNELVPKVLQLAQLAKQQHIAMTIDAEEADRLELSLDVIETVYADKSLDGWPGFGLAVQAYQKRTVQVIDELAECVKRVGRRMCVRLVKGAYWDSEVKRAQIDGHRGYPVFTRKHNTDLSYLACARRLLAYRELFYPQFATHNAHTIACIHHMAQGQPFEFQRLHGMGGDLYDEVVPAERLNVPCRVYAPVGSHEDLLPYLVRRLLENGANTSFVNRIVDAAVPAEALIEDPVELAKKTEPKSHPKIPLPINLYGSARQNSRGINFASDVELEQLSKAINAVAIGQYHALPLIAGTPPSSITSAKLPVTDPSDRRRTVGTVQFATAEQVASALEHARKAQRDWDRQPVELRAQALERAADLLEERSAEFMALCLCEAGKTLSDAIAEVREAVDFCRYYAQQARRDLGEGRHLAGPTGESNTLSLRGRGIFVCISPWNFPLAIFLGQVVAALVTGNAVLAKPAEQTNLIAFRAVQLLHEAGIPEAVLQFLPGEGKVVGNALCQDPRVTGVCFTGSTETARAINRNLAGRDGPIAVLIAETGGQNALFADSSALPEQVVRDVLSSSFGSAGQRCSAARLLIVQEDVADKVLHILAGAMDELKLGHPAEFDTDIGPVIDERARSGLSAHIEEMKREAKLVKALSLDEAHQHGSFLPPHVFEIRSLSQLRREQFGPILHVLRYAAKDLDKVIDELNALGYGLTLGVHSRIDSTVEHIVSRVRAGNCYVNRNIIGAVVGVQPFGGEGLSGTGPKAGGPHYLHRFVTERTLTVNTAAVGGNASLLAQGS
jgi:RHH-type proline utilization regulon transcriptional repressor/proline dehydrogenase/delta 1-pyrroline-5-carboxylate dehydrogenase